MYGNGNGIYVMVYIPGIGWVLVPLSAVLSMGGFGGGMGGFGGMGSADLAGWGCLDTGGVF